MLNAHEHSKTFLDFCLYEIVDASFPEILLPEKQKAYYSSPNFNSKTMHIWIGKLKTGVTWFMLQMVTAGK